MNLRKGIVSREILLPKGEFPQGWTTFDLRVELHRLSLMPAEQRIEAESFRLWQLTDLFERRQQNPELFIGS
jgi:hypothetical protein